MECMCEVVRRKKTAPKSKQRRKTFLMLISESIRRGFCFCFFWYTFKNLDNYRACIMSEMLNAAFKDSYTCFLTNFFFTCFTWTVLYMLVLLTVLALLPS